VLLQRPSDEDDLGDQGDHLDGDQMPPQAQAIELLCRCDDIPDDGVELRVLKGLLTAATSSATHLHGQVRSCKKDTEYLKDLIALVETDVLCTLHASPCPEISLGKTVATFLPLQEGSAFNREEVWVSGSHRVLRRRCC
jgi:hypothetical protein